MSSVDEKCRRCGTGFRAGQLVLAQALAGGDGEHAAGECEYGSWALRIDAALIRSRFIEDLIATVDELTSPALTDTLTTM